MANSGLNVLSQSNRQPNRGSAISLRYNLNPENKFSLTQSNDPYGKLSMADMMQTEAKAQYDGVCVRYPVPDTSAKLYRIHGQVNMSLNKQPKQTFISEIFKNAKHPERKRMGPSDYKMEKAFDYATQHNTKRFQWDKVKRNSFTDDVIAREKRLKGPADYNTERKKKIPGTYTQN